MKNNELSYLWTAEKANTKALHGMWHEIKYAINVYHNGQVFLHTLT